MNEKLTWGLLGTGSIARKFAGGLAESKTGRLTAIGSRTQGAADKFAADFPARAHGSYEALLDDPEVDAVYISTPHPWHAEWAIKTAEAGKHVLCEKPLTMNHAEAMAVVEAARANGVFLMEAFMYRCHPQTARLIELIRSKEIGDVRLVQAEFSFRAGRNLESRLFNHSLGGGGILDVGCYCASMARLVAGVMDGQPFANSVTVKAVGHIGSDSRVDEFAIASIEFANGVVAQLAAGVSLNVDNSVRIRGTDGCIVVPSPWLISREPGASKILVYKTGSAVPEEIVTSSELGIYAVEADAVAAHIGARQSPAMSWEDSLGNMETLDRWRSEIGLVYDLEKPEAKAPSAANRPLSIRPSANMKYGAILGIAQPISRLILGCDNQRTYPHAAAMFDDFFERGGNCFDTAWIYAGGLQERLLGQWIGNRGLRDRVIIIGKGAHTPHCTPEGLTRQLHESLDRLQTDHVDLYMMHRDNPEVPVAEFLDVLNEHKTAGRVSAFGVSNWTIERIQQANDEAASRGLCGIAAVSNNLSLARMVDPVWAGCVASSEPAARAWHERTQMPLLAWSSQARGFFTNRAGPDKTDDAELARCWYSDDNFERRRRAIELAEKKGVLPINIALAYVLAQPFPTFALVGPRVIEETRTTTAGTDFELTPDEVRWLNLQS